VRMHDACDMLCDREKMSDNKAIEDTEIAIEMPKEAVLVPLPMTLGGALDEATLAKVRKVLTDGTPANTRRAYATDIRYFGAWRELSGFVDAWPVPADELIRFVAEQVEGMPEHVDAALVQQGFKKRAGQHSWSTVERRVAALATAHRTRNLQSPTAHPLVTEIVGRARRASVARGWTPKRKAAAERRVLERLLATCDGGLVGIRDRALLLFGFASGGRRRSEISEATVERLQRVGEEFIYRMGRTKTEQDGGERPVPVAGKAAKAMNKWLTAAGIQEGPLFRAVWDNGTVMPEPISVDTVARIIKRRAVAAGLDPEMFGGHSLRAGFMTEAGVRRASLIEAMSLSGHKDVNTAVIYYRAGEVLRIEAGRMMDDSPDETAAGPNQLPVGDPSAAKLPKSEEVQVPSPSIEDHVGRTPTGDQSPGA
jgi:integrase